MKYQEATRRLADHRQRIAALRAEMREIQDTIEPQEVADYRFSTLDGDVPLSALFAGKRDLFVIHNMGTTCAYCTLWADGFNGAYDHLASRAAFVVSSPDTPSVQKRFADSRGWRFPMVSHRNTDFAHDMGYGTPDGGWTPGVSVFRRDDARIVRVSDTGMQPGDAFCAAWHFFDLLPGGSGDWQPRFAYG
ncbi:MAG TPA: DUF899 family protein [Vineibacter sp.]|nr:DUF899 family protein [Vineibacter sp.]